MLAEPEATGEAQPWRPGLQVERASSLTDIIAALSFGRTDASQYQQVAAKLSARGIKTVGSITSDWQYAELTSALRAITRTRRCP
jgi:hypothetical protein